MGEGLDHLQPLYDLLNLAVYLAQCSLLSLIVLPAPAAQGFEQPHGQSQDQGGGEEQLPVGDQHDSHQPHKHQTAGEQGDKALLQGHLYVVCVVGKAAHQLAVGVAVEVGQGQLLQLVKQLFAQAVGALLGQPDHNGALEIDGHAAQQVDGHQLEDGKAQAGKVGAARPDKVVDDAPQHIGAADVGGHRGDQTQKHQQQGQRTLGQIAQQTQGGLFQIFGIGETAAAAHWSWHYSCTPSC